MQAIRLNETAGSVDERYHNAIIASVNDHVVRLSIMTEPFRWHHHPNSDEYFQVMDGAIAIDLPGETVTLAVGDTLTVPAGTPHRTRPLGDRSVNITVERLETETIWLTDGARAGE